jgi:hypothetical protein
VEVKPGSLPSMKENPLHSFLLTALGRHKLGSQQTHYINENRREGIF